MRNPTHRRLGALLAASVVALAGCTAGGSTSNGDDTEDVELTFFTFETPNLTPEFWDETIERASADVPGVKINRIVGENSLEYVQSLFASGQAPDLIAGGISLEPFVANGQIAEWSEDEIGDLVVPDGFAGVIDGTLYSLPSVGAQSIPLVYYNKDAFEDAGIEQPPTSWDEFLEVSEKLMAAGITPIEIGGGGEDTWVAEMTPVSIIASDVLGADPEWFAKRAEGEVSFTDLEFVAAAQKTADLSSKGYFDTAGLSRSYADTEQAFRDQKAAMYPMGNWFAASADATPLDFELGVFAMPGAEGNLFPVVTGSGLAVNAEAEDVELAKKWALAWQTNAENVAQITKADGGLLAPSFEIPEGMGDSYLATNEAYRAALKAGNTVPAWLYNTAMMPPGFSGAIDPAIVDLINLRMTAEEFGAFLDQKWDELSTQ
jgi:multiple sugar transport system substrate-binding protein